MPIAVSHIGNLLETSSHNYARRRNNGIDHPTAATVITAQKTRIFAFYLLVDHTAQVRNTTVAASVRELRHLPGVLGLAMTV